MLSTVRLAAVIWSLLALLAPQVRAAPMGYPVDPNWSPPRTVYIPETGQTVDGLFLDLWRSGGGALSFGNPITPELTAADGHVYQYYEYARFEYWPEGDGAGNYVTLGKIGAELRPLVVGRRVPLVYASVAAYRLDPDGDGVRDTMLATLAWLPVGPEDAPAETVDWRYVPETEHGVWGVFRWFWEATGEAAYLGNPLTEEFTVAGVTYQIFERGQLAWEPGKDVWVVPIGEELVARYGVDTTPVRQGDIPTYDEALFIPPIAVPAWDIAPPAPAGGRAVVVSLSQQALWAYEDGAVVRSTYVSTGTERFHTPPGLFYVNSKLDAQTMEGVLGGEYYNVPNVPWVMYFTNYGHALHGTYWHENFGVPMSHGCVNLPMDVAEWMYGWAPMGMPVLIIE
jgi:hypothetical protein